MYCDKCGAEISDEVVVCPECGKLVESKPAPKQAKNKFSVAIKVFMIIGCIANAIISYGISLLWTIPMTIHYFHAVRDGRSVGTGFKICSLLFVNLISGVLMLCDND